MAYQILALDLDGTLTNSQKRNYKADPGCSDRDSGSR